jgi:hypothetical protein
MFQEDAGGGLANIGSADFAIPFIQILQKGSPQVSRANAKYIKGAAAGMIINTVTGKVVPGEPDDKDRPTGILFIPCGYQSQLVRWKPRDSGGGLVCHYKEGDPELKKFKRNERGQLLADNGDLIIDTSYHFGLALDEELGFPEYAVISMASTQRKKSRTWNTIMRRIMFKNSRTGEIFNPPSYSHAYRLTTVGETKDTYDWYGWAIVSEGQLQDVNLYKMAKEFSQQVASGNVKVSAPPNEFESEGVDAPHPNGDDIPF